MNYRIAPIKLFANVPSTVGKPFQAQVESFLSEMKSGVPARMIPVCTYRLRMMMRHLYDLKKSARRLPQVFGSLSGVLEAIDVRPANFEEVADGVEQREAELSDADSVETVSTASDVEYLGTTVKHDDLDTVLQALLNPSEEALYICDQPP